MIRFEHLSEAQKRAYLIADNQLTLQAGWTKSCWPRTRAGWGREFDLELVGFDATELERLLAIADGERRAGRAPRTRFRSRPEEPVTSRATSGCWATTGCCAATPRCWPTSSGCSAASWPTWPFADPPYNVDYANTPKDKLRGKDRPILNDNLGDGFEAFLQDACTNILAVTKGAVYVCMSTSELHTLQRAFAAAGGKWSTFVIWAKSTFTLGRADYQRQYEPILYGWKEGADHYWCGARDQGDVWFFDKPVKNDLHPTMKPVALVERAIRNSSKKPRHRARPVRRLGLDPDRLREDRTPGAADRARSEVRRRDLPAVRSVLRHGGGAGRQRASASQIADGLDATVSSSTGHQE